MGILQFIIGGIVVADAGVLVLGVKGQGGIETHLPGAIHCVWLIAIAQSYPFSLRGVPAGILQVSLGIIEITYGRVTIGVKGQGGIVARITAAVHRLGMPGDARG